MYVDPIVSKADAYRQTQYYAGEHLAYYYNPTSIENRPKAVTKDADGTFTRYVEKENGQRQLISQANTREQLFLEKRLDKIYRDELFERLNYKDGVYYGGILFQANLL